MAVKCTPVMYNRKKIGYVYPCKMGWGACMSINDNGWEGDDTKESAIAAVIEEHKDAIEWLKEDIKNIQKRAKKWL
jgi:hypothetical protein